MGLALFWLAFCHLAAGARSRFFLAAPAQARARPAAGTAVEGAGARLGPAAWAAPLGPASFRDRFVEPAAPSSAGAPVFISALACASFALLAAGGRRVTRRETLAAGLASCLVPSSGAEAFDSLADAQRVDRRSTRSKISAVPTPAARQATIPKPSKAVGTAKGNARTAPTASRSTPPASDRNTARKESKPNVKVASSTRAAPATRAASRASPAKSKSAKPTVAKPKVVKRSVIKRKGNTRKGSNVLRDSTAIALVAAGVQVLGTEKKTENVTEEAKAPAKAAAKDKEHKDRFSLRSVFSRSSSGGGRNAEPKGPTAAAGKPGRKDGEDGVDADVKVAAAATMTLSSPPAKAKVGKKTDLTRKEEHLEELIDEMETALKRTKAAKQAAVEMVAKAELRAEEAERRAARSAGSPPRALDQKARVGLLLVLTSGLRFLWTHRIIVTILP